MPTTATQHDEQVRGYFDQRMSDYDGFYEPASRTHQLFNRVFRKAVYARRDQALELAKSFDCNSLLDIGCGSGRNTAWWARNGVSKLHGVEFSSEMIREAEDIVRQAGVAEQCSFDKADFLQWDSVVTYDIVVACGVFDYVVDAEGFLAHMAKFASKVVYGSFPKWTLVRSPLRRIRYALRGCPTHFYSRREIERIFERVEFGQCEIQATDAGYLAWAYRN